MLIHLSLPRENRLRDVGEAVPQKTAVLHVAQAFSNARRANDIGKQENSLFCHRVMVLPREKTADLARVVKLSHLEEPGDKKRRDDSKGQISQQSVGRVISDTLEGPKIENDRAIDRVYHGQRGDHEQCIPPHTDDAESEEGHPTAPAREDQLLPHAEARSNENPDQEAPECRE
ncbi:MAG TPA: hypothetical protein EYQ64_04900 [Gemmatimonadetes bacterium]|nr:hypothetical protein [Gemmatimonadota bacterium]